MSNTGNVESVNTQCVQHYKNTVRVVAFLQCVDILECLSGWNIASKRRNANKLHFVSDKGKQAALTLL